jgi:hypothetical protein
VSRSYLIDQRHLLISARGSIPGTEWLNGRIVPAGFDWNDFPEAD